MKGFELDDMSIAAENIDDIAKKKESSEEDKMMAQTQKEYGLKKDEQKEPLQQSMKESIAKQVIVMTEETQPDLSISSDEDNGPSKKLLA